MTTPRRPPLPAVPPALRAGPVAVLAGLALWCSFPPLNLWWLAPFGLAAFVGQATRGRARAVAARGWLTGLGLFVPMLAFLRPLGVDAWLVVALVESLWFGLLAVAIRAVAGRAAWPVAVVGLVVGQEWLRDRVPFGGFPWGRLGFAQASGPLLHLAAVGGVPLLTATVAAVASALACAVSAARTGGLARPLAAAAVLAAAALGGAALVSVPTQGTSAGGPAYVTVAAVQGNVPELGINELARRYAVTADHEAETERLAAAVAAGRLPRPQLVIWPENASDQDPTRDPRAAGMVRQAVAAVGVPVLVGAILDGPGKHTRNAGVVWSPATGPGQVYAKRHLVPFGEYLPFRALLTRLVGRFSRIPEDFVAGHRPGVLQVGAARVADVICFEVADDGVVRAAVDGGGRLIAVQTNNATYERDGDNGHGGETAQQLEMSQLRAVEHGRAVVVAATSGVSAIVAPNGRVLQRTAVFRPAALVARLPLRDPRTVADRLGPWPERVVAAVGAAALLAALPRRRRGSATGAPESSDPAPSLAAGR